jgi:anti-sigma B factor antagonist
LIERSWRGYNTHRPQGLTNSSASLAAANLAQSGEHLDMALDIVESQQGDVTVLTLSGMLRMGLEADQLKSRLQALMARNRTNILLNVDELSFIDSYGLGELVASLTTVKKSGGSLKLTKPTEFVREVLRTTRLTSLFASYDSEAEALASFSLPDRADSRERGTEQ